RRLREAVGLLHQPESLDLDPGLRTGGQPAPDDNAADVRASPRARGMIRTTDPSGRPPPWG
ncbi:hypothetical protein AB0D38_36175, partial [Streptomyces sp. NPDC048279]|uniref:hypothetical protein n=1 Tax=Streptomyces sp. NPDC048279 TaxID=3154714 RepID=UPI0034161835